MASITSSYPGPSHSVAMMTSSISSDEDMLDITTSGTTQVGARSIVLFLQSALISDFIFFLVCCFRSMARLTMNLVV